MIMVENMEGDSVFFNLSIKLSLNSVTVRYFYKEYDIYTLSLGNLAPPFKNFCSSPKIFLTIIKKK